MNQREYSVEEVMSFKVEDIQHPDMTDVRIKGWLKLSREQQKECISKLRELKRERDEPPQSVAVNATELEAKLRQVRRSPSQSPTPPPDSEAEKLEKLEDEKGFHKSLVDDHGRPCYPIELAPEVYRDPGPYRDIISYWDGGWGARPIGRQLQRWNLFRREQRQLRDYFLHRNRFPEYQQRVIDRRRKHGLDGDVQLLADWDKQSSLAQWIEYQDYELRRYEQFTANLEKAKVALVARRKAVAEAGLTAYEDIQDLDFGGFFGLSLAHGREEGPAWTRWMLAEEKLELAESRLKAAESDDLGDIISRESWVQWFQEQIDAAQAQLGAVPKYYKEDWLPEGKYYVQEGKDERERTEKTESACGKRYDDEMKAENALRLAKEGLQAAWADDIGEDIERAALVEVALAEVQSARAQFEKETKTRDEIRLKGKVVGALGSITSANLKMEQHQVLLKWIEQQRWEMTNGCASIEGINHSKRGNSRLLRARHTAGNSGLIGSSQTNCRRKRPSTEASILKSAHASGIIKSYSKRRGPRQKTEIPCIAPQPTSKATIASNIFRPEKEAPKAKDDVSALRSIHSSRIFKSTAKSMSSKPKDSTRLRNENGPAPRSSSSTRNRTRQPLAVALRRSSRILKRAERLRPG